MDSLLQNFHSTSEVHLGLSYSREFSPTASICLFSATSGTPTICASWIDGHLFCLPRQQSLCDTLKGRGCHFIDGKIGQKTAHKETKFTIFPREPMGFNQDNYSPCISSSERTQLPISSRVITGSVMGLVSLFEYSAQGSNFAIHRS